MLVVFAAQKSMFRRGAVHAVIRSGGLRWAHNSSSGTSYAPKAVSVHLDMIRRHTDSFPDEYRKNYDLDQRLEHPDVQLALGNFERVTGITGNDAREMMQYAAYLKAWINRLLTWKEIHRGEDLFLPGLGGFNVTECFQEQALAKRRKWAFEFVCLFKASFLRPHRRKLQQVPASSGSIEEVQEALASYPDLDLADMLQASKKERKKNFRFREDRAWQYVFSGANNRTTPFWLPTVGDLRTQAYFADTISSGNKRQDGRLAHYLQKLLSRPKSNPQQQHLVRYHDHWNNPNNIQHAMAEKLFEQDGWDKLGGNLPPPKQLWKALGLAHLANLPDHGRLRVLRNRSQIVNAGEKLHNCLRHSSHYVHAVEQKQILLVCMDDDNGKPIAVGQYNLHTSWWTEIKGKNNDLPTENMKSAFKEFERRIILPWMSNNPSADSN